MASKRQEPSGYGFGTFQGVFTPSILTIIGVVMYLRFGWMLGNVGLATALFIVTLGNSITFLTGLSISALATNMRIKGGGAYFILSRTLGLEAGAALGIPLALSQAIAVSFYVAGFSEALVASQLPVVSGWDPRLVGLATLTILAAVASLSADIALKSQYFIMAAIGLSLASFFLGGAPEGIAAPADAPAPLGFWPVFAVFFPAVTGILSGLGMSGDLKDPSRSIPRGTLAAIFVGYAVYMSVPIALNAMVPDAAVLRSDTMILQKCARWQTLILVGVWAATLSSAIGSFLCAPRVFQALSRDRLLPAFFGRGFGASDDPRLGALFCFGIAAAGIALGDINVLAPILTLFNLSTYGLLNLSAAFEEIIGAPSWRPTFRVKSWLSLAGFVGCVGAMFMISPGWTFVAIVCEGLLYWHVKRRALRARWGDMRTGLFAAAVRVAFRHIERLASTERNWRPNLLVMAKPPLTNSRLLKWSQTIAGGRSFVTVASVIPENAAVATREQELRDSMRRTLDKIDLEAAVKIMPAPDAWSGITALVQAYGYGPIVPNTILRGVPSSNNTSLFASLIRLAVAKRRNVIVLTDGVADASGPIASDGKYLDIWWRGKNVNAGLMLALAVLLQRGGGDGDPKAIRVNTIVRRRTPAEMEETMSEFLRSARVNAETRILVSDGRPFADTIREGSSDAAISFVGLRAPEPDESAAEYAAYFRLLCANLRGMPPVAFVLAAEDVDFRRIFEN